MVRISGAGSSSIAMKVHNIPSFLGHFHDSSTGLTSLYLLIINLLLCWAEIGSLRAIIELYLLGLEPLRQNMDLLLL
jgi:hypothetical protein